MRRSRVGLGDLDLRLRNSFPQHLHSRFPEEAREVRMCASFSPPPTPTRNSGDICSNCKVFQWSQPESAALKQCSKCKVLKYCSEDCQVEHWKLVHSKHCKELAAAKTEGRRGQEQVANACQHLLQPPLPFGWGKRRCSRGTAHMYREDSCKNEKARPPCLLCLSC